MTDPQPVDAPRPNHSPEGKARSRLNAVRHGLTGQLVALTPEESRAYENHCKNLLDTLAPVGALELDIARSIADGRWRLKRASAIETGLFADGNIKHRRQIAGNDPGSVEVDDSFAQSLTWADQAHNLQLLTIYEQRIQRAVDKNEAHLKALQTERKQAAQEAIRQATLLYQLAQAEGKPYQPEAFFTASPELTKSVFSTTEIAAVLSRSKLLNDAETCVRSGKLPAHNPPPTTQHPPVTYHKDYGLPDAHRRTAGEER